MKTILAPATILALIASGGQAALLTTAATNAPAVTRSTTQAPILEARRGRGADDGPGHTRRGRGKDDPVGHS